MAVKEDLAIAISFLASSESFSIGFSFAPEKIYITPIY
jgi:hypothetical protein